MRVALLWTVLVIATGLFLAVLVATWHHRAHPTTPSQPTAVRECFWAMVPWLIVVLAAAPAVHRVLKTG
jgi:heme/copper-type cytochrome/quinol oxidase subunit 2